MKKIRLLFMIALSLIVSANLFAITVTISGTVTDIASGVPIPNHGVTIQDTSGGSFVYFNTLMTNASGYYSTTITNVPSGTYFIVGTLDCYAIFYEQPVNGNNSPITVNFQICAGTPPPLTVVVSGTVTDISNGNPVANHMVQIQDTASGSYYYYNSMFTNSSGYYSFTIPNVPPNTWFWVYTFDCNNVIHSDIVNGNQGNGAEADFQICVSAPPLLTVTISGTVTDIANGAPIPNHLIHIQDSSGGSFVYNNSVYTDANGFYSVTINNVPNGIWFQVSTLDCNNINHVQNVYGNNTPITANFQICTGNPPPTLIVSISGTVTDIANGNPVPNHIVVIQSDSSYGGFSYYSQQLTNSAGFYSVTIQNVPQGTTFDVGTYDCNYSWHEQTVNGNNTPITVNFQICTGNQSLFDMYGLVFAGNSELDAGKVDLIKIDSSNIATVIDTWYIQDTAPGHYEFHNVLAGNYYLKAEVADTSAFAGQYAPTYFDTTIYWTNATIVHPQDLNVNDIHLVPLNAYAPGNGSISGTITQNLKSGVPMANIEVLLLDQNNQPLTYTKTDVNGEYAFQNLAYGTYIVYPEITGVTTIPSTVTLNANNPSAIVNFLLENGRIITGIKENTSSNISSISDIFPNPAVDKANIIVVSALEMSVTLTIFNSTGQTVKEMPFSLQKGSNTITFTTSGFYEGMYYIRIQCTEGDAVMKKFVIGK